MQGSFSDDALDVFNKLVSELRGSDFSESESSYDFTRCVRPDGSAYGTRGKCKKGTQAGEKEKEEPRTEGGRKRRKTAETKAEVKAKPIMTNAGTEKWPMMVKTSVPNGNSHRVPGYSPSDVSVYHKGQHYSYTGKKGHIIKTGEPSKEFQTDGERRVYVSDSGKLYED